MARGNALFRRLRWQLPITFALAGAALAVLAVQNDRGWNWSLFLWGLAIGVAGACVIGALLFYVDRRSDTTATLRAALRLRLPIYLACWLGGGALIGAVAAIFDRGIVDVVGAAYSAASILGAVVLVAVMRRRTTRAQGRSGA